MESLSILVIAVTGFLYVNLSLTTRYKFKRSTDWSAYLYVVAWGVGFFFIAWSTVSLLSGFGILRVFYDYLSSKINLNSVVMTSNDLDEKKNLLKLVLICILSIFFASLMGCFNRIYYKFFSDNKLKSLSKIISNNPLESLALESHIRSFPILVTLSSSKVYVGLIPFPPILEDGRLEHISLLPLLSGYRDTNKLEVKFTTNYYNHYKNFSSNNEDLDLMDFNITFPISEILSISLFDMDTYNEFQKHKNSFKTYFLKSQRCDK